MTIKEQVIQLANAEPNAYTYRQAAEKLKVSYKTFRTIAAEEKLSGFFIRVDSHGVIIKPGSRSLKGEDIMDELNDSQIREVVHAEQKAKIAHEKHSFTERKYKLLMQEHERVVTELEQLTMVSNGNVKPMDIKPRKTKRENEAVPCLVWSDWHTEEKVDPRSIGGKNKFTLDIAKQRAAHVAQSSLKLIEEDSKRVLINDVAIFILGDFITGNIHEENVENAQLQPVEAALFAQGLLEGAIDFLLANSKLNINVYCKVGNHSRITHKVHVSTEFGNSLELAMYVSMMKRYRDRNEKRVSFHIEPSYYSIVNILGVRVRFHHGHAVSYGGGVGGLHIPLRKAIKSWNETARADFDIMGHYHSFLEHSTMRYLVNGSLIGYNAYAERVKAIIEPPIQGYCLIHKKYGVTRMTPVFAE
jgi:hypothetical protein